MQLNSNVSRHVSADLVSGSQFFRMSNFLIGKLIIEIAVNPEGAKGNFLTNKGSYI